jgi:hypothetical protein
MAASLRIRSGYKANQWHLLAPVLHLTLLVISPIQGERSEVQRELRR